MKLTCDKEAVLNIITAAEPITGTKNNLSILSNVLLETTEDNKLRVMASNMETTLQGIIDAKIAKQGSVTINQNKLHNYLRNLPQGDVLFDVDEQDKITIKSMSKERKAQATIIGLNKSDFPEIPSFPEADIVTTIDKSYFKRMIQKTIFAVATDNTQHVLNGILLQIINNQAKMVAIDGRRLAIIGSTLSQNAEKEMEIIIPQHVLSQLSKIITSEGPLTFSFTNNRIFFKMNNLTISSVILDGKFPKYDMFIPKKFEHTFAVRTEDIKKAISLAAVLVDTESNKMVWDIADNTLNVSAQNTDYGKSDEELVIQYSDNPVKFGLNFKLVSEILREIETDEVTYSFNNENSQIKIAEKNRNEYFYIVMPMKLDM